MSESSARVSSAVEIERKYAVPDGVALPALGRVPGVTSVDRKGAVHLDAVYLDTADRALLAAGIVVRRREGGHDAGWHVKLRGTVGRVELHAPIDPAAPDAVPEAFAAAMRSRVRGRALTPIARIRTERSAVVVVDSDGGGVEVVDDLVTATDVAAGVLRSWREWEAEQATDSDPCAALLERVHKVLLGAGARPSDSPAKIAQALGLVGTLRPAAPPRTAGDVVGARIAAQTEALHGGFQALQLDGDPDGAVVHDLRKTIRRIRSLLALDEVAGPDAAVLRERLGTLGRRLGEVRDPRVAATTAEGLLDLDPGTPGLDAARALLVDRPLGEQRALTAALAADLGAAWVLDLMAELEAFAPDGPAAAAPRKTLVPLAEQVVRRARKRAKRALGGDLEAMHRGRKATKRARFVVEELVAAGVIPEKSKLVKAAKRDETAQDVLGDHRDLAVVLEGLPALAEELTAAGGNAFALGRVAERGRRRLAPLHRAADRAARRLD